MTGTVRSRSIRFLQSTYLGGISVERAKALAIHPWSGEVYVAGQTTSSSFPGTSGGAQPSQGGGVWDAFVARLNPSRTVLLQSTFLGGSGSEYANALAIDPMSGEVYVAGETESNPFPGSAGAAQSVYGGGANDRFVARFNVALTGLLRSTYLLRNR
jgi:hypothetical protein